jgi:hypothetical protein
MRLALAAFLALHGLIHLVGFASAFGFARFEAMSAMSRSTGMLWLNGAIFFVTAAILLALDFERWWVICLVAIVQSQGLIAGAWKEAKVGTIANLIALAAIAPGVARMMPGSLTRQYAEAVRAGLADQRPATLIQDADLAHLPANVQRYLRRAGVVGREAVWGTRAVFEGRIRNGVDGTWMPMKVEQYNFFPRGIRAFHIDSSLNGIPFEGLHLFDESGATMRIRVASMLTVVDASGPEMNQSETVTVFNDMCLLAPSTLIDPAIRWEPLDSNSVRATFTRRGITIRAVLRFGEAGDLVDFESDDRYQTADGRTYAGYPWTTPLRAYGEFEGRRIWTRGDAIWRMPGGPFVYGEFRLESVEYNPRPGGGD